jgi:hypothetical protein
MHDVDCISAVAQLRRGLSTPEVETCRALFITANADLARESRVFFQADAPDGSAALCITDYSLGNLLWLKNPTKAPDLPQKLILADAYAAMQPPDALWKGYLAEIARLEQQGRISSDEYFTLRHNLTAKRTLMELTAGEAAAFTEGTVVEVLRVAKEHLRADLEEQLQQERRKLREVEQRASSLEQAGTDREERLRSKAARMAKAISQIACLGLLGVLAVGALLTFPWSLPEVRQEWYRYLTTILLTLFFVFTLANIAWGTSVRTVQDMLEEWLGRLIQRWLEELST